MKVLIPIIVGNLFSICHLIGMTPASASQLDGGFYYLSRRNADWSQEQWADELAWMRRAGMNILILSSAADGQTALYPTQLPDLSVIGSDPLSKILIEADRHAMEVHLGLYLSSAWWHDHSEEYLQSLARISIAIAEELHHLYGQHPSLKGYYLAQEIDNLNWQDETIRKRLVECFLRPVSDFIKTLNPNLKVSTAPFFNSAFQAPVEYGLWWEKTLLDVPNLDLLMPQDGIGVEHADFEKMSQYFQAFKRATDATNRTLWSDLEIFTKNYSPAPIERIARQIQVALPYVEKIVVWELGGLLSPYFSKATLHLYLDYLNYLAGNPPLQLISLGSSCQLNPVPDFSSVNEERQQLTDGIITFDPSNGAGWQDPASPQIILDLGSAAAPIHQFRAFFLNSASQGFAFPKSVLVSCSTDGDSYRPLGNMEIIRSRNEAMGLFLLVTSEPVHARYIQFDITADSGAVLCSELQVFSTESSRLPERANLALSKSYHMEGCSPSPTYPDSGGKLTDGIIAINMDQMVGWRDCSDTIQYTLDLEKVCLLEEVRVHCLRDKSASDVELPLQIELLVSNDGTHYQSAGLLKLDCLSSEPSDGLIYVFAERIDQLARYVQFIISPSPVWTMICELEVWGSEATPTSGRTMSAPSNISKEAGK